MKRLARMVLGRRKPSPPPTFTPKLLIFDFDGTIGDTFEAGFEILNQLAGEFGFKPLKRSDLPHVRNMRTRQLLSFLSVPTTKLTRISRRGTQELASRIHTIQPLPGLPDLIRILASRPYTLGIITSNSESNVRAFLANHSLEHFTFIRSSSKLMGKAREIRSTLKTLGHKRHEVLFVGDETRDIEACKKAGIPIAAVTWGYNSRSALEALQPEYLLHHPSELLELLDTFEDASPDSSSEESRAS